MELEYTAITLGLADELFSSIQSLLAAYKLRLLSPLKVNDKYLLKLACAEGVCRPLG